MAFDGQPFFVRINGRVWVTPEEVPEDSQCTAMTKRRKRCGNPLDYGQSNGFSWLKVAGGYVDGFDYDTNTGQLDERGRRYLEQRCELHFDTDARARSSRSGCRSSRPSTRAASWTRSE